MKVMKPAKMPSMAPIKPALQTIKTQAQKVPKSDFAPLKVPKVPSSTGLAAGIFKQKMAGVPAGVKFSSKPPADSKMVMGINRLPRVPHQSNI